MDGDELPTRTGGWDFILGVSEDLEEEEMKAVANLWLWFAAAPRIVRDISSTCTICSMEWYLFELVYFMMFVSVCVCVNVFYRSVYLSNTRNKKIPFPTMTRYSTTTTSTCTCYWCQINFNWFYRQSISFFSPCVLPYLLSIDKVRVGPCCLVVNCEANTKIDAIVVIVCHCR